MLLQLIWEKNTKNSMRIFIARNQTYAQYIHAAACLEILTVSRPTQTPKKRSAVCRRPALCDRWSAARASSCTCAWTKELQPSWGRKATGWTRTRLLPRKAGGHLNRLVPRYLFCLEMTCVLQCESSERPVWDFLFTQ
jgi:hypothetical protein